MSRPKGVKNKIEELAESIEQEGSNTQVAVEENKQPETAIEPEYTLEIIKDFDGAIDVFYLNQQDPNYQYRWLRDDPKNLTLKTGNILHSKGGWQICPKSHLLRIGIKEKELGPDGLYRRGDTILAFMPKYLYKQKEEYKTKRANEPLDAIQRLTRKGDPKVGGKEMHHSMRGIQTAKALGMGSSAEED